MSFKPHLFIAICLFFASCSKSKLVSNGSRDTRPLLFEDEYEIKELPVEEVKGHAVFGIPSFGRNNRNNHTSGFLFYFNGVQIGRTPRILPMLSLAALTVGSMNVLSYVIEDNTYNVNSQVYYGGGGYYYSSNYRYDNTRFDTDFFIRAAISIPVAGMINNLIWSGAAYSGASQTINYNLIKKNPEIDLFFYPKYDLTRENLFTSKDVSKDTRGIRLKYLWVQDANVKARVMGAKLKLK